MQIEKTGYPTSIALRNNPHIKGTLIDTSHMTLQKDSIPQSSKNQPDPLFSSGRSKLSEISRYRNSLQEQGRQEQSMVITRGSQVVGSIGQDGSAMFQDSAIGQLWQEADRDPEVFADLLEKKGYGVETYSPGSGPVYAEIHQRIHGGNYADLIERQTTEFYQEMIANSGNRTLFKISL